MRRLLDVCALLPLHFPHNVADCIFACSLDDGSFGAIVNASNVSIECIHCMYRESLPKGTYRGMKQKSNKLRSVPIGRSSMAAGRSPLDDSTLDAHPQSSGISPAVIINPQSLFRHPRPFIRAYPCNEYEQVLCFYSTRAGALARPPIFFFFSFCTSHSPLRCHSSGHQSCRTPVACAQANITPISSHLISSLPQTTRPSHRLCRELHYTVT